MGDFGDVYEREHMSVIHWIRITRVLRNLRNGVQMILFEFEVLLRRSDVEGLRLILAINRPTPLLYFDRILSTGSLLVKNLINQFSDRTEGFVPSPNVRLAS